jgi:hypothetical protein
VIIAKQVDPLEFAKVVWPRVRFYKQQKDVIYSVMRDDETYVPAGNKLGKDFVAGFLALWFFLTRHPCRVITTSAKDDHLRVLWGEINWFIANAEYPLDVRRGGRLIINHQEIRKVLDTGQRCSISYLKGMVAAEDSIAAMGGHHADPKEPDYIPHTLFVGDEASSLMDRYYGIVAPWAKRMLIIGNTWPCENFFKKNVQASDLRASQNGHFYRRVIRIRAVDSPNIRLALAQIASGKEPSGEILVPGVKTYDEYIKDRATRDAAWLTVSHDAEFYEGAEVKLFPVEWLNRAEAAADRLAALPDERRAKGVGIDPAEGGDRTAMCAVDEHGIIELVSRRTPDTSVITGEALAFMRRHQVPASCVCFDRGGGGKQHADRLRVQGHQVRTVAFGESIVAEIRKQHANYKKFAERLEEREDRYVYVNRRAEMYGELSQLLDPAVNPKGFGIPRAYGELRRQLVPIPRLFDPEGRLKMLPKNKRSQDSTEATLTELLGCSPDEADATVLAVHAMLHEPKLPKAGVA